MLLEWIIVMPSGVRRGGAEESLLQFLAVCVPLGVDARVALLEQGELAESIRMLGVEVRIFDAGRLRDLGKFARTVASLRKWVWGGRRKVVLGWMTKAHVYNAAATAFTKVPAVWFQHGLPGHGWIDRLCCCLPAHGVLCCSTFVRERQALFTKAPVHAVKMAADVNRFDPKKLGSKREVRERLNLPINGPIIGMVARLQQWKGGHVFVEAMAHVIRAVPEATAIIVGGPHELEPDYPMVLEKTIQSLGLRLHFHLAGRQSNVEEWMHAMDVVIHAAHDEPFGISIVEAMSLGKPVIASIPGGPAEIIRDGEDGVLVRSGDAKALGDAIIRFLAEPAFAYHCATNAEIRARAFSPERFARSVVSTVNRMVGISS